MNLLSLPWQWGKKTTTKKTGIYLLWPGYDLVWTLKMYKGLVWKCPRLFRSMWSNAVKEGCLKREAACTVVAGSPKTGGESGWLNVSYQVSVLCPPLGGPLGPGLQGLRNLISLSGQPSDVPPLTCPEPPSSQRSWQSSQTACAFSARRKLLM